MQFHIDRFTKMGGAFIVHGWSEGYKPGDRLVILAAELQLDTITKPVLRPDLPPLYGDGSEQWGFRAFGIEDALAPVLGTSIGLRFADGNCIDELSNAIVPIEDHRAHAVWANFVAEVNAKGGRLLEIGSRARSGSTIRELFNGGVEYVGVDITAGPNVDIVADAHCLSEYIDDSFDYVCSISTFEHFILPWKVALEINKSLKVGGRVFTHSHQTWPEHDVPFDYFRFSEQAWGGLFNVHTGFRIVESKVGHAVSIASVYNVGGLFDEMDLSPGHAMSVCVAEKIGDPMVTWDAPASLIYEGSYSY